MQQHPTDMELPHAVDFPVSRKFTQWIDSLTVDTEERADFALGGDWTT